MPNSAVFNRSLFISACLLLICTHSALPGNNGWLAGKPFCAESVQHSTFSVPHSALSVPRSALSVPRSIYYIDARYGSDANRGTSPQQAWKTIGKINSHVFQPGDQLLFKAGSIYEGQLKPQGSGTRQQPVRVGKYGEGYKPRIQGNGCMPGAVFLYNVQGWEITELDVSNYGVERAAKRTGVAVTLTDFGTATHIVLKNLDIHDVNGSLIKEQGGGAGIIFSNNGKTVVSTFDGLLVEQCSIKRCERNGILINGYSNRADWHPSKHVVIRNNLLEGVPGDGIVPIGCDSALIEHNIMRDCPRLLPDGEAAAGIWPWSCDNTIIQYNEVSDHKAPWDAQGFDSDWNCRNTHIQYNYSHDNEGGFLLVCNDGNATLPRSVGNTGTIVRYNLSVNDGIRTTGLHAGFSPVIHIAGLVSNTKIYNNVLYVPVRNMQKQDSTLIAFDNWNGYADSTLIANNIFYALSPVNYEAAKAQRIYYEHNLYYGNHSNKPADAGAIFADPLFSNTSRPGLPGLQQAAGFKLRVGSPAVKKGKKVSDQPIHDFFGNKVPDRSPAIGIHQQ